jgi:hypothetical protein
MKMSATTMEISMEILKKLKIELLYDPDIPFFWHISKGIVI